MVHGYHLILPMYGFWLPNDPRGSWSDVVRRWELVRFGTSTQSVERKSFEQLTDDEIRKRDAAKKKLKFPAVSLSGIQAASIGRGFATKIAISQLHRLGMCYFTRAHSSGNRSTLLQDRDHRKHAQRSSHARDKRIEPAPAGGVQETRW